MIVKWDAGLKPGQRGNPVMFITQIGLRAGFIYPTDEVLYRRFTRKGHQLKTWGRTPGIKEHDPHWLGVRGQGPLHIDPAYPRYSYQLKVRIDPWIRCRGYDKEEVSFVRGTYYVLDTHSPHQVLAKDKKAGWNVSISYDSSEYIDPAGVLPLLLEYGEKRMI